MPPQPSNSSDYSASLPSNQCLFVRLAKQLSPHIFFCCKVKKLGTVIYRKDGDILEVLTFALVRQSLPDLTEESQLQRGGTFPDEQLATIEEASSAINHRLQEQAQKLRSKYCNAKTLTKRQSDWAIKSQWSHIAVIHKENVSGFEKRAHFAQNTKIWQFSTYCNLKTLTASGFSLGL